ncbi:MAG: YegS/Rv2252/BmrU family lipid kinase [Cyanobacteriota bacterium]
MSKPSAWLIFNPGAGSSETDGNLTKIQLLLEAKFDLTIRLSTENAGPRDLAKEAIANGADLVIASGGDGTVSAVGGTLLNTQIPLGVIPTGTVNAFAAALGIPSNIEDACITLVTGKPRVVDAARCNDTPIILEIGVGFEGKMMERTQSTLKKRIGAFAYILAGFQELRELESFDVELTLEERMITLRAAAITIANAAPPQSVLAQGPDEIIYDDGLLDVTVVSPENISQALLASYSLLQSSILGTKATRNDIGFFRVKRVKVKTNPPQQVVIDGEDNGKTPIEVECLKDALTVIVPKDTISPKAIPLEEL